jgi:GNAT superfamily N-acetyltransferase
MCDLSDVAYETCKDRWTGSKDEFLKYIEDWNKTPVFVEDEVAGVLLNKGSETHACILKPYFGRWIGKWFFGYLSDILKREGYITTTVMSNRKAGHSFVKRLGFVKTHETDGVVHYEKRGSIWE